MTVTFLDNTLCSLPELSNSDRDDLRKIAGKTLKQLLEDSPNLLVYPHNIKDSEDKIGDLKIFEFEGADTQIRTGNLMGFFGIGDLQIRIKSRFDDNENDFFLHYMLSKVLKINLFDYKTELSNSENNLNLLYYIFPALLNKALRKGVYRKYKVFERNDSAVKGPIDLARHIKQNLFFNGKIAYRSREYCTDNSLTQLIRHTIEVIRHTEFAKNIFRDKETRLNIKKIEQATQTYEKRQRMEIMRQNSRPLQDGYYADYAELQQLCMLILQHKTAHYKANNKEIYGILFDGAWLWEEYLWKILEECNFEHAKNKNGKNGIYLFEKWEKSEENIDDKTYHSRYRRYPDYYRQGEWILDAKYKHLENGKINRDDMHQIIAYMHVENAGKGSLIYPFAKNNTSEINEKEIGRLRGSHGIINIYGFPIPNINEDFTNFKGKMEEAEKELKNKFSE